MLIICQQCMEQFKPKRPPSGKVVTHQKCRSIFKIVFTGSEIDCEHCGARLLLKHTEDPDTYIGFHDEKKEAKKATAKPKGKTQVSQALNDKVGRSGSFSSQPPNTETAQTEVAKALPAMEGHQLDSASDLTELESQDKTTPFTRRSQIKRRKNKQSRQAQDATEEDLVVEDTQKKKYKRHIGSFAGSLCLFFAYLVFSNGFEGNIQKAEGQALVPATSAVVTASVADPAQPANTEQSVESAIKEVSTIENIILPPSKNISSKFGFRVHPLYKKWRFHQGIDIPAKRGKPVKAALSGRVIAVGKKGGYGNYVVLEHKGGYTTLYGHNQKNLVQVGKLVKQGESLALVGSTGHATGPHIHFELRRNGVYLNPLKHRYLHLEKVYQEIL